jgi:hypothetical protein
MSRTKLSSLRGHKISKLRRDKHFPHYVILYNTAGKPILQIHPNQGDVWDGSGNIFDDDVKEVSDANPQ